MKANRSALAILFSVAVVASACTAGASPTASFAVTRTTVNVTLQDWTIAPETYAVVAGDVTFHITNLGELVHGFAIIKTGLAGDAWPSRPDASVDEQDKHLKVIAQVKALAVGQTRDLTVSLDGGWYLLLDNVEGGLSPYQVQRGLHFFVD